MRAIPTILTLSLALLPLDAQDVGAMAPDIEWTKTYGFDGIPSQKLSQLRGSVVLLEFWATYADSSRYRVKLRNELQEKMKQRGLVVIAITNEPDKDILAYNEKNGAQHPVASGPYPDYSSVRLIPYGFLIDKEGKIAWRGRPDDMPAELLDKLLVEARPPWVEEGLSGAHKLRIGDQNGEAHKLLVKLLEQGQLSPAAKEQAKKWKQEIEQFVADAVAAADTAEKEDDPYLLWSMLEPIAKKYAGVPGGEQAAARLEKLTASKKNQQEIEAGQQFAEAQRLEALFDFDKAIEIYTEVGRRMGRTKAGKNAKLRERELLKKGMLGYDHTCAYCRAGESACPTHARKK